MTRSSSSFSSDPGPPVQVEVSQWGTDVVSGGDADPQLHPPGVEGRPQLSQEQSYPLSPQPPPRLQVEIAPHHVDAVASFVGFDDGLVESELVTMDGRLGLGAGADEDSVEVVVSQGRQDAADGVAAHVRIGVLHDAVVGTALPVPGQVLGVGHGELALPTEGPSLPAFAQRIALIVHGGVHVDLVAHLLELGGDQFVLVEILPLVVFEDPSWRGARGAEADSKLAPGLHLPPVDGAGAELAPPALGAAQDLAGPVHGIVPVPGLQVVAPTDVHDVPLGGVFSQGQPRRLLFRSDTSTL